MPKCVQVRVPASTTNLGPGFDALGLALGLHNRMRFTVDEGPTRVQTTGEGAALLARGRDNLVVRSAERLAEEAGLTLPAMRVQVHNAIPVSRGLGSSSTAIVGGLVAANELLGGPLSTESVLALAVDLEGHPDNVSPALLGGFQVTSLTAQGLEHLRIPSPVGVSAVVCIPDRAVSTEAARAVLPAAYSRADAVFNVGRVALLVARLITGQLQGLAAAMEDRIHQPYRADLIPGFREALAAATDAGALGACLSGSGSTLLALTRGDGGRIGEAMALAVRNAGCGARWLELKVDEAGAALEDPSGPWPTEPA